MKKVLIITYYWPPSGGAGVQRWLKFTKYLRSFGWEPVIYTAEGGEMPSVDESLLKDIPEGITVIKKPIWEPYSIYKKFIGAKSSDKINTGFLSEKAKPGIQEKLSVWVRGNFFIPDARRFWIKPSVKFLTKYLQENKIDAMVSTGPPHSMHLIALGVKKKLNIPWLADFRDPWTKIDFYDKLMLTPYADELHKKQEKEVIATADKVVTVSRHWAEDFKELGAPAVDVITNGFDEADFDFPAPELHKEFSLSHIGSLNKDRNPLELWNAIKELCEEIPGFSDDLKIKFAGKTDHSVFEALKERNLLQKAEKIDYMPHEEVVKFSAASQVLLLLLNNTPNVLGIIPGKIFEYLAAKRPVLCIGPKEGDSAEIIEITGAGKIAGFTEKETMKEVIRSYYQKYKEVSLNIASSGFEKYSRKNLTGEMAALLNQISVK
jgi:hypothetical protein